MPGAAREPLQRWAVWARQPVTWVYDNLWELTARDTTFAAKHGFTSGQFDFSDVSKVDYKGATLTRDTTDKSGIMNLSVSDATKTEISTALDKLKTKGASVFTGPIKDQSGAVKIPAGTALQYGDPGIEGMDWFVQGVVGTLAK